MYHDNLLEVRADLDSSTSITGAYTSCSNTPSVCIEHTQFMLFITYFDDRGCDLNEASCTSDTLPPNTMISFFNT
jgi:hypothetical protein